MEPEYVEQRNGGYYVTGSGVSLDSIVYAFRSGESPETICQNFPTLSLEQAYGAVAFYLRNQAEVDANILAGEAEFDRLVPPLRESAPDLYEKLQRAREQMGAKPR